MHAHRLPITIPSSRHIEIDLPADLPEGEAEVIVLVCPVASARPRVGSHEAILAEEPVTDAWRAANSDKLQTADEIDAKLAENLENWGDDDVEATSKSRATPRDASVPLYARERQRGSR